MSKRAPLDLDQFKIELPKPTPDPLESIIPTTPPSENPTPLSPPQIRVESRSVRPSARTSVRSGAEPPTPFMTRIRIRHPFNIYADQLEALQRIQIEKVRVGKKKPTLAKMVTQALDEYLARHYEKKQKL